MLILYASYMMLMDTRCQITSFRDKILSKSTLYHNNLIIILIIIMITWLPELFVGHYLIKWNRLAHWISFICILSMMHSPKCLQSSLTLFRLSLHPAVLEFWLLYSHLACSCLRPCLAVFEAMNWSLSGGVRLLFSSLHSHSATCEWFLIHTWTIM